MKEVEWRRKEKEWHVRINEFEKRESELKERLVRLKEVDLIHIHFMILVFFRHRLSFILSTYYD